MSATPQAVWKGGRVAFAACGRNGEHHSHLQGFLHLGLSDVEVPKVALVEHSGSNGLGRVYHRTTPYGQHHVGLLAAAQVNAFVHFRVDGVGLHTAHLAMLHADLVQGLLHAVEQAAAHHRTASVDNHHLAGTMLTRKRTDLCLCATSEDKLRGAVEYKIVHAN